MVPEGHQYRLTSTSGKVTAGLADNGRLVSLVKGEKGNILGDGGGGTADEDDDGDMMILCFGFFLFFVFETEFLL